MGITLDMLIAVFVGVVLVVVFMGPGLWSSSTGYPLIERPWKWLRAKLSSGGSQKPEPPAT